MPGSVSRFLDRRTPFETTAAGLLLVGILGVVDHLTGYEISFSIFYLLPTALVAWFAPRRNAVLVCVASAAVWLTVDFTAGHVYSNWLLPVWGALAQLGFFLVTTLLLGTLRTHLGHERLLARTDSLTGVLNARAFKEACDAIFRLAGRHGHETALAYIDIDYFKSVNDAHGHAVGDRVLASVAETLARCVRSTDLVGRLGGDEFAVLLPETDGAGARKALGDVHAALVRSVAGKGLGIGFSIGVALFEEPPGSIDEALGLADSLMYRVKEGGRNGLVYEVGGGSTLTGEAARLRGAAVPSS